MTADTTELLCKLESETKSEIRAVGSILNYLVAGQKDGTISLYDLGVPGKEKLAKLFASFAGKVGMRLI